jgi:hypothetical protein
MEEVKACTQKHNKSLQTYIQRWCIIKNTVVDVFNERAIGAFTIGLRRADLVEEMGRIKPKIVAELMDIANRFADGKGACHNRRTRSPEDDRGNMYSNQRRISHNYDNYGSHSQVATGYRENNYQGEDRGNIGYRNNGREDSNNIRQFQPRGSREYNQSLDGMLNGTCHMHYAYVDGKRVSRHTMKDCRTFLKLQEAVGHKQAEARRQGYDGNTSSAPQANQQAVNGAAQGQGQPSQGNENDRGYFPSKGHITAMIQPVPKSNKE